LKKKEDPMAEIRSFGFFRHLRADTNAHVLHHQGSRLVRSGRGLSFWFRPWSSSLAEIPTDDREMPISFHGRSADFQDVMVQGILTYRIVDPVQIAERIDFSIDLRKGTLLKQPLEKLALMLSQLAQQHAVAYIGATPVQALTVDGYQRIRACIEEKLGQAPLITELGLAIVSIRISSVRPGTDLEKALEAPTRERIQQEADEATFRRRALAVEKERAIQENELQNQIELARREEQLISQRGQNARREATEKGEAGRIEAEGDAGRLRIEALAEAERTRLSGEAQAEGLRALEGARVEVDRERMGIYRDMPPSVLAALAGRELAGKLQTIEHLTITPDLLGSLLTGLVQAGTKRLEQPEAR
jgi:regulator of protease activity HflC (stomatin/prohibitin superfamily)